MIAQLPIVIITAIKMFSPPSVNAIAREAVRDVDHAEEQRGPQKLLDVREPLAQRAVDDAAEDHPGAEHAVRDAVRALADRKLSAYGAINTMPMLMKKFANVATSRNLNSGLCVKIQRMPETRVGEHRHARLRLLAVSSPGSVGCGITIDATTNVATANVTSSHRDQAR